MAGQRRQAGCCRRGCRRANGRRNRCRRNWRRGGLARRGRRLLRGGGAARQHTVQVLARFQGNPLNLNESKWNVVRPCDGADLANNVRGYQWKYRGQFGHLLVDPGPQGRRETRGWGARRHPDLPTNKKSGAESAGVNHQNTKSNFCSKPQGQTRVADRDGINKGIWMSMLY